MAQPITEIMTPSPRTLGAQATVREAARTMANDDIGDVIVCDDNDTVCGIITDRDIAVRVVAEGKDASTMTLGDICTRELTSLSPSDTAADAVRIMREQAIRRLPVVDNGKPIGIISIGDLAIDLDRDSALADISAAPSNND